MTWDRLRQVGNWPRRMGKHDYLRFLNGESLTRKEAILAKCYECIAGEDSHPCQVDTCPLIGFCPWNKKADNASPLEQK